MRIDLGCGTQKHPHCLGIDKNPYPVVDIVHNLTEGIPLRSNVVKFVMASHVLQYVDDLQYVMREIYRICEDRAIVCLVVPYAHVSSHVTNPQFKQLFNEYSPQHWSPHPYTLPDAEELVHPLFEKGLLAEHTSEQQANKDLDLRLLRLEHFYFPEYQCLYDEVELRRLRQTQMNVVYQLMMHLLVVKSPLDEHELLQWTHSDLEEPQAVSNLRSTAEQYITEEDQPIVVDKEVRKVGNPRSSAESVELTEELRIDEQYAQQLFSRISKASALIATSAKSTKQKEKAAAKGRNKSKASTKSHQKKNALTKKKGKKKKKKKKK